MDKMPLESIALELVKLEKSISGNKESTTIDLYTLYVKEVYSVWRKCSEM